jgi:hypothetical protein
MSKVVDRIVVPCGCLITVMEVNGEKVMGIKPCSLMCPVFSYVRLRCREQGKPMYGKIAGTKGVFNIE